MKKANSFSLDKLFVLSSILYITVPVIIFFFGWLRTFVAVLATIPFIFLIYYVYRHIGSKDMALLKKETVLYWLIAFVVLGIWVYYSGIGGFSYQNSDHWVRNPIYRDMCRYDWPMIYDLSKESSFVQAITGTGKVAFSYYFTWWLVPALFSKLLNLNELGCNVVLLLWSLIGVLLVLYNINRLTKRCSYMNLFVFALFSGMDFIGFILYKRYFSFTEHLEWWTGYWLQYTGNTTQLYWVFNQSIPLWMIMSLVLQLEDNKYIGSLCSLAFIYSPWAVFGVIPLAWVGSFFRKQSIKQAFNPINTIVTLLVAAIYGLFYMASSGSSGGVGTTISFYRDDLVRFILTCVLFLILEAVAFLLLSYKENKDNIYYKVVFIELLLCPMIFMRDGNFTMRASLPALFIMMIYVLKTIEDSKDLIRKTALIIMLSIGSITSICEINRSREQSIKGIVDNEEEVYSFGDIRTDNVDRINIIKDQFFIYDYNDALFFKHLSK